MDKTDTEPSAIPAVAAWIDEYLADPDRYPVLPQVEPGQIRELLPDAAPVEGEPISRILEDFRAIILPGITHWNHPRFMAYFATSSSEAGIVGEMLTSALNVNGMLWRTSPSATELEEVVVRWLRRLMGIEQEWFGMITDTASISTMLALAAAREAREELRVGELGLAGRPDVPMLRVYCSSQAHSSVEKGAMALGIGQVNVVKIPSDAAFRMRPDALARAVRADRDAGMLPLACVATVGTTSTTSVDPVPEIADICERENLWLHVDAAYGGALAVVPEHRDILEGVDRADSMVVNPHKWLFTPMDCSVLYTRRPDALRRAFSLTPEYLQTSQSGVVNFMDYGVQLGRRFRALKLWMVLRHFGANGIAARIRGHCELAREFASRVEAGDGWEVMAPVPMSVVCFRYAPAGSSEEELDRLNEQIMHRINSGGSAYLSHTRLDGRYTLRVAIGNLQTTRGHTTELWNALMQAARA